MAKVRVIIELARSEQLERIALALEQGEVDVTAMLQLEGVDVDPSFAPVPLPAVESRAQMDDPMDTGPLLELMAEPQDSTYVVRAEVDESSVKKLRANPDVVGVYSDPVIEPCLVCPGSPAVGTDADVERLLCVPKMRVAGMDGTGVLVAVVDTGINLPYLQAHGKTPNFDASRSWMPRAGLTPGNLQVGHGTMCAYDVCIAAPKCTLLDVAVLQSTATGPTPMSGVLSDAVRAYRHLINIMLAPARPGEGRSLVVSNSWGMFDPAWDFPVGDAGNYSDNPNHPFNRIAADLELAGADILFAAGNCGANCPDGRCNGNVNNAIYGANSSAAVLCVAGVDVNKDRVGYSTIGPGRLIREKPDISAYTHFRGSGVYPADGGTSAACPVAAGVVAALRSKRPRDPRDPATTPTAIRNLVRSTAEDRGAAGYDFEYGYGVIDGCALAWKPPLPKRGPNEVCNRYPWLCRPPFFPSMCRILPRFCESLPQPGGGIRDDAPWMEPMQADISQLGEALELAAAFEDEPIDPVAAAYALGRVHGEMAPRGGQEPGGKQRCD